MRAAQALYEFVWNEYCDWYLELSKAALQSPDAAVRAATRHTLLHVLETSLRALHPIMPFITEEIWQRVKPSLDIEGESIMLQPFPRAGGNDASAEDAVAWLQAVIQGVRRIRSELNLPPGRALDAWLQGGDRLDRKRQVEFGDALGSLAGDSVLLSLIVVYAGAILLPATLKEAMVLADRVAGEWSEGAYVTELGGGFTIMDANGGSTNHSFVYHARDGAIRRVMNLHILGGIVWHDDRFAAELRVVALLDGRIKRIHVDVQDDSRPHRLTCPCPR